jgi:hypothetical protein
MFQNKGVYNFITTPTKEIKITSALNFLMKK